MDFLAQQHLDEKLNLTWYQAKAEKNDAMNTEPCKTLPYAPPTTFTGDLALGWI